MSKATHITGKNGIRPLTAPEKSVLWALSDEHGHLGDFAELSVPELVERTRLGRSTVKRALRGLERDTGITSDRPEKQGAGQVTRYHFNVDLFCRVSPLTKGSRANPLRGPETTNKGSAVDPVTSAFIPKAFPPPLSPPQGGRNKKHPRKWELEKLEHDRRRTGDPESVKRALEALEAIRGIGQEQRAAAAMAAAKGTKH